MDDVKEYVGSRLESLKQKKSKLDPNDESYSVRHFMYDCLITELGVVWNMLNK